ncbi:MAG: hypothetical protein ACXWR4_10495 [Bdellovibrionota bacterium]
MKFFLLSLCLVACASARPVAAPPAAAPAPVCVPPGQSRDLGNALIAEASGQAHFGFMAGNRAIRIGSGKWKLKDQNADWNRMYGWGPVVWVTDGKRTRVLDLRAEFPSSYVSQVFHDQKRIFLFLDYGVEGPAEAYKVWISQDAGEHWYAGGDLHRPPGAFPPATLESFFLDDSGLGTAWLKMDASNLSPEKRGAISSDSEVYFRAVTPDCGLTWKAENTPAFSTLLRKQEETRP